MRIGNNVKRWVAGLGLVCGLSTTALADGTQAKIQIPEATIQLTVPLQTTSQPPVSQLGIFYLSDKATNGVIPNLNVQRQSVKGLTTFQQVSIPQFKSLGWTVLNDALVGAGSKAELRLEYTGQFNGVALHWLAKAVEAGDSVVLITCTTHAEAWKDEAVLCKQALDSVKIK